VNRIGFDKGTAARRAVAVYAVTWRRVRARPGRTLLVSVGVAVAVAFLVGVAGGSVLSEDLALRHALASLPAAERVVRVSWSGQVAVGGPSALDRDARRALRALTREPIAATLELADVNLGTGLVKLGAADSLRGVVDMRSGRLPTGCAAARCEVVQIGGTPVERINQYGVNLVVVGRGMLASLVPFGEEGLSTQPTAGGERPEPVLLTTGVAGLAGLKPLVLFNRNFSWSASLAPSAVHVWDVDALFAAEGRVQARLEAIDGHFSFVAPDDALSASRSQSETASQRVLLVGSSAAMLLLAFAGITAGALRRDARAELRRLQTRGATRAQQWVFLLVEAIAAVVPGSVLGLALGAGAEVLLARHLAVSASAAIGHGLETETTLVLAAAGTVGAVVAVIFALRGTEAEPARGVRPADMAALGAVVALVLLLVSGQGKAGTLGRGAAVALAATPLLASFAFCVLVGRLLGPVIRVALRAAREGPSSLFLAVLTLHRSPGRTVGIVGFLAVSIGLAAFALSYRATLAASSAERAAYAVPLDYTLGVGPALVEPRDLASLARYRSLAPGVGAWPILRQVAEVAGTQGTPDTPTVLGVPSTAFRLIHGWRSDFSADDPATLGRLLRPTRPVGLAGARIPLTATRLELPARVEGATIQPVLVVQTATGGADQLVLPLASADSGVLSMAVPAADRGGRVIAVSLDLPPGVQRSSAHQQAEGENGSSGFAGTLRLGPLSALTRDGRVGVTSFRGWIGRAGVTPRRSAGGLRVGFQIDTSEQAMLRPRQPFDSRRLPVVVSPDVAAVAGPGGVLELNFGDQVVSAQIVAQAKRFPTTQDSAESFVVADEASLAAALGADDLPTSIPDELWLSAPPASSARLGATLGEPPFASLAVASRSAIAAGLSDDPLARGIVVSLLAAAAAAVALALVGLALVTAGFLRDESDLLFDLESQGVGPRALRACVRWRAFGLAGVGLAAGVVLGVGMVAVTGRLLALDATLTLPDPPLRRITPWLSLGASACAFALFAAALIELVLRVAHRSSAAGRGLTGESWVG
jgi:hypothetical protein